MNSVPLFPRRIAFFDDRYHQVYGSSVTLRMAARAMFDLGHDVKVFTTAHGVLEAYVMEAGVPVEVVPAPAVLQRFEKQLLNADPFEKGRAAIALLRYSEAIARRLKGFDLVIASSVRSSLLLTKARMQRRPAVMLYAQNSVPLGSYAVASVIGLDHIALISPGAGATFPSWVSRRYRDRMSILPLGRSLERFAEARRVHNARGEILSVLTVCAIEERKGIDLVLRALARARETGLNFKLTIVGSTSGERSERYRDALEEFAIEKRLPVEFAGYQSDVLPYYREADIFVLGSHAEGQPGVLIEAMASGLPCVTTDAGGCSDIVLHERTGYVIRERDEEQYAEALRKLADVSLREKFATKGIEWVEENFTIASFTANLGRLVADITADLSK